MPSFSDFKSLAKQKWHCQGLTAAWGNACYKPDFSFIRQNTGIPVLTRHPRLRSDSRAWFMLFDDASQSMFIKRVYEDETEKLMVDGGSKSAEGVTFHRWAPDCLPHISDQRHQFLAAKRPFSLSQDRCGMSPVGIWHTLRVILLGVRPCRFECPKEFALKGLELALTADLYPPERDELTHHSFSD
ncbi:hypothetical protein [Agrobacterium sp. NPDC090283]|uniref:hypothetical protein n=1 Tax=Agrobacterium sp. NPDC090283 TaxID=3363920 RepID=UPI00383A4FC5